MTPIIGILFNSPTKIEETKNLLILVKLDINPPRTLKFEPPEPLDPNDPLIKKLEAKLKK